MKIQRLRGTRDIFGDDAIHFQILEKTARQVFENFGFKELRTPILEEQELFTRALGTETDVVQKEMYEFEDRSKTRVALRPEGTAGVVRAYLENEIDKKEGLAKFFYLGPMFRSERPQAGRLRQFHQIGVEQLGVASPYADAETIHCLASFLRQAEIDDFELKLNNLGTFEERGAFKDVLKKYFRPHEKSLCQDCKKRLEKNVFRVLDCKVGSCRLVIEKSPPISGHLSEKSREHFATVCEALESGGIDYVLDPYMVRGLDYYTKTVFEVSHPKLGAQDALAAGGRYDHLIENFGGPSLGAVGFAVGVERLLMCLSPTQSGASRQNTFFIAALGERAFKVAFQLLGDLRENKIAAFMDLEVKSLKSQMRSADKSGSRYVIILGDNEIDKGIVVLKDLSDGNQKEVELKKLKDLCSELIPAAN